MHRGDAVVLTPLDEAYAMRPSLAHLNTARADAEAKAKAAVDDDEDDEKPEPQPLTVRTSKPPRVLRLGITQPHGVLTAL